MHTQPSTKNEPAQDSSRQGFTLTELSIVIAVIGILAAIAVPSFITWLNNSRLRAASQELQSDLQHAKSEAIKRNKHVVVILTPANCLPAVPAAGGGYTIFADDGTVPGGIAKNNIQEGSEPSLLQVSMPTGVAICAETFTGTTTGFLPTGYPIAFNSGTVTLQNNHGRAYTVTLNVAGNITLD